jgi:RNA recognition motif-containing protein
MEIFVGNLPQGTNSMNLRQLLEKNMKKSFFQKLFGMSVINNSIKIDIFQKKHGKKINCYGHIDIPSEKLATAAIEALNGLQYKKNTLVSRVFVHRAYSNDRRAVGWRNKPWDKEERRLQERRSSKEYFWGL